MTSSEKRSGASPSLAQQHRHRVATDLPQHVAGHIPPLTCPHHLRLETLDELADHHLHPPVHLHQRARPWLAPSLTRLLRREHLQPTRPGLSCQRRLQEFRPASTHPRVRLAKSSAISRSCMLAAAKSNSTGPRAKPGTHGRASRSTSTSPSRRSREPTPRTGACAGWPVRSAGPGRGNY